MLISGIYDDALTVQYGDWPPDGIRRLNEDSNQLSHKCQIKWQHPLSQGHECEEYWSAADYEWLYKVEIENFDTYEDRFLSHKDSGNKIRNPGINFPQVAGLPGFGQ